MKNEISIEELNSNVRETQETLLDETRNMFLVSSVFFRCKLPRIVKYIVS